jgi:hypothetical protein
MACLAKQRFYVLMNVVFGEEKRKKGKIGGFILFCGWWTGRDGTRTRLEGASGITKLLPRGFVQEGKE